MAITVAATGNAVTTASRSPSVAFSSYTSYVNDVIVFAAASGAAAAAATAPSGWVLPTPASGANPVASDSHTYAFTYHLVTNAEELAGTTTFTATNLWNVAQTGNVTGIVLRGVDPAAVIDSLVTAFDSTNTVTPHVLPALTGANLSTGSMVVRGVTKDATGTYTTPATHTARGSNNTNMGNNLYTHDTLTTSGSNVAATNITPSAGDEYCSFSAAFSARTVAAISTLTEGFASQDDTKWLYKAAASVSGGQLTETPNTSYTGAIHSNETFNLTGSSIYVKLPQRANQGANSTETMFVLAKQKAGNTAADLIGFDVNGTDLLFYDKVASTGHFNGTTYNATNHAWLKISESGGTITFAASADGISYSSLGTLANPIAITELYVTLQTGYYGTEPTPGTAIWDNVNTPPPVTGTLATALQDLVFTGTGTQASSDATGTVATVLQKLSASFTGDMLPSGTLSTSLIKLGFSGTGTQTQTGTLATSLQKTSMSATGVMQPAATLAAALLPLAFSGTGTQTQTGTLATALQKLAFSGTGEQTISGTMGASLQKLSASLTGVMQPSGTLAAAVQKLAFSATGDQTIPGALAGALQPLAFSATGTQALAGSMATSLQKLVATLTGSQTLSGAVSTSLQKLAFTGTGEQIYTATLSASLQKLSFSSTGTLTVTGALTASLLPLQLSAAGAVSGAPANMTTSLQPLVASFTGTMLPTGTLTATLQKLAFSGQATQTQTGTLAAVLQPLTASAAGEMLPSGSLDAVLKALVFSGSGTLGQEGQLAAALQPLVASIVGGVTPEGVLATQLAALVMQASGSGGVPIGVLAATLPALIAHVVARAYRLALERMTVVEIPDRTTAVSLQDRTVVVEIADRSTVVTVPDRTSTVELQDRTTTVIREV